MSWLEITLVVLAGVGAGTINTLVGAGTLITFPTLLALGFPPVVANVSNALGMIPGGVSGTWGYRALLRGQRDYIKQFAPASLLGATAGALLLLALPPSVFQTAVPALLLASVILVLVQPRLQWAVWKRSVTTIAAPRQDSRTRLAVSGVFAAGIYGGYFGAAQGVILIGLLGVLLAQDLQRTNGLKNALSLVVNTVAGLVYVIVAPESISWPVVALVSGGTLVGGVLGARIGVLLKPPILRGLVVLVGIAGIVRFVAMT